MRTTLQECRFQWFESWEAHRFCPWGGLLHFSSYDVFVFVVVLPPFPKGKHYQNIEIQERAKHSRISFICRKQTKKRESKLTSNLKAVAEARNKGCITNYSRYWVGVVIQSPLLPGWKLLHSQVNRSNPCFLDCNLASSRWRNDGAKIDKKLF